MPADKLGHRKPFVATKAVEHGAPTVELGFPGIAFKTEALPTFLDPADASVKTIAIGKTGVLQYTGEVELPRSGGLASAVEGDEVWIKTSDNTLATATGSGFVKFGRVVSRDASRTPQSLWVSLDARNTL